MNLTRSVDRDPVVAGRQIAAAALFVVVLAALRALFTRTVPSRLFDATASQLPFIVTLAAFLLVALGLYYALQRREPLLSIICMMPGIILFSENNALASQFVIFYFGRHFPLIDAELARVDALLGFDWTAYFMWVTSHALLNQILTMAYQSIWWQPAALMIAFMATRRFEDYSAFLVAMPVSFAITCLVALVTPALGAYQFHGMSAASHPGFTPEFTDSMTAPITWLREGRFDGAIPYFRDLRVITFPSWHAAAATILILSSMCLGLLRYPIAALNGLMILATPVQGSHYLTDIIAGSVVGALSFVAARAVLARVARPRVEQTAYPACLGGHAA